MDSCDVYCHARFSTNFLGEMKALRAQLHMFIQLYFCTNSFPTL